MNKAFHLLVFQFIACMLFAQQTDFVFRNYTAVHGIPQSQVSSILEDQNGYLWMGTVGGGLTRFDGKEFKVYTTLDGLLSNIVNHIALDSKQNLWIAHQRGITRFDGDTFKKFQAPAEVSALKMVRKAYVFNDTVFIASVPGLLGKIHKDSVYYWGREYEKGKLITRIHQAPNGQLYLFLNDGRLLVKTESGDKEVGIFPSTRRVFSVYNFENEVRIMTRSTQGEPVITYTFNPLTEKIEPVETDIQNSVLYYNTSTKTYWLYSDGKILTRQANQEMQVPVTALKEVEVNQIYADKEGNTWIGTNGNGLFKYYHQDFSRCSSDNMRGVMNIMTDNSGSTWISTMSKGLWRINKGKISSFIDNHESYRNAVNCAVEGPGGIVWIGTRGGLGKFDEAKNDFTWYTTKDGLAGYSVLNISFDEKGNSWIGTSLGLNYFDGQTFTTYTTDQGLLSNTINAAYYSKEQKKLYVGSEFGVNTISNGKVNKLPIRGFENTTVLSIQPYPDSLLLFGSGGSGFAIYNPYTAQTRFITTRDGLQSDFIYFIAADEKKYIWVGSEKGISRLLLNQKLEIVENLHFDNDNGLEGVETNQNAFYLGAQEKYFGLIDGLYQFNEWKPEGYQNFGAHLTGVDIFYGEESARMYADSVFGLFKLPYYPVFPADKNHITFSFNRVDKRYPKSVRFKYFLKNFDKGWSQPSPNKMVTYGNLPPGVYEFQLMATNNQGSWSETLIRYPFIVKAPFYQTATFAGVVFIVLACIITFIFYRRVRHRVEQSLMLARIREQEQASLRKEIARDFHDEMGNKLTRIINYISLLKLNGNGNGSSHADLYTKVEDSAKYLYSGTRDFIWSIDPVNDELSKLFLYIRDFGEKLFEEKGIQFRAFNEIKGKVKLPYGFSRQANLIFKEVMTNAFKSAQAQNATFTLKRNRGQYELSFEDDGIGFNVAEIENSNGLKNIRERAEKLDAVLRIRSKPGAGTTVTLSFQLIKTQSHGTTF